MSYLVSCCFIRILIPRINSFAKNRHAATDDYQPSIEMNYDAIHTAKIEKIIRGGGIYEL